MIELSVIIPVLNESRNIGSLLKKIKSFLDKLNITYEIIIVDGGSKDGTVEIASRNSDKVIIQKESGFANALHEGFKAAQGETLLTLDADLSHPPDFIPKMLEKIKEAEIVVASRYTPGGNAEMAFLRYMLSRLANLFFQYGLSLPLRDITSGFRAYQRKVIDSIETQAKDFAILPEILIEAYAKGWQIREIPFHYAARRSGRSHLKMFKFALDYLKVFLGLWKKRNSLDFCDYDERGYYSRIFLQRYWQRKRYKIIMGFIERSGLMADLGCGSSKIIQDLPEAVALDLSIEKLRYIRKNNKYLIKANLTALPFKNEVFSCIVCSQVIEHVSEERLVFKEMTRILRPEGILVLGTPDYGKLSWWIIEFFYGLLLPGGYKDKHVIRYTNLTLRKILESYNFKILAQKYICGSELIIKAKKKG